MENCYAYASNNMTIQSGQFYTNFFKSRLYIAAKPVVNFFPTCCPPLVASRYPWASRHARLCTRAWTRRRMLRFLISLLTRAMSMGRKRSRAYRHSTPQRQKWRATDTARLAPLEDLEEEEPS